MTRNLTFRLTAESNEYRRQGQRPSNSGEIGRNLTESQVLEEIFKYLKFFGEGFRFVKGTLTMEIEKDCVSLWWNEKGNDRFFAVFAEIEDKSLSGKETKKTLKGIAEKLPHPVRKPFGEALADAVRSVKQVLADFLPGERTPKESERYGCMLLDRLRQDCDFFIGLGWGCGKQLWAGSVKEQIEKMRELHRSLPSSPEWLSMQDIDTYEMWMNYINEQKTR